MSSFVNDILAQPSSLQAMLDAPVSDDARALLRGRTFDRIVLAGMGASHFANYQLWYDLVDAGLPAWWVEAGELLYGAERLLTPNTLLWLTSQSGHSGEIVALLHRVAGRNDVSVLGITNDLSSPLATHADVAVDIRAGAEHAVGTKTYLNTLATNHLLGSVLTGAPVVEAVKPVVRAQTQLASYLAQFGPHLAAAEEAIGRPRRLILVGRGRSSGNAASAALTIKEAAKVHAEGMSASQFRHGVIELATAELTVVVLGGTGQDRDYDLRLANDLASYGADVVWLGSDAPGGTSALGRVDEGDPVSRRMTEVVPLQLVSVVLAAQNAVEPGEFVHASKVTATL